jgi:serine/threonine protein kinase/Tfp pilus assembly protein PilF
MDSKPIAPVGLEIASFLGSGGTANVYLARRKSDNFPIAIKVPLEKTPNKIMEFDRLIHREYELINKLKYPGLVGIFGVFYNEQNDPYLELEYCSGQSLDGIGRIENISILLNVLSSISINLHYLNLLGLTHGDLKPHNIFLNGNLESYNGTGLTYCKISDFSLAYKTGEDFSCRLGLGTVGYMAPETIDSGNINHQTDIFALGIISYFLATGKYPYRDNETDPIRINAMIKEQPPIAIGEIRKELPSSLPELIMSMLSIRPENRPSDAYQICEALAALGAKYPYKKAIRPKHLFHGINESSVDALLNTLPVKINESIKNRMFDLVGDDKYALRNLLEINFTSNRLIWDNGVLSFTGNEDDIIWPSRVRRKTTYEYSLLSFSQKKKAICAALTGGTYNASIIKIITEEDKAYLKRPILYLIKQKLSQLTIARLSNKLAKTSKEIIGNKLLTASLFLQAENLEDGFSTITETADELIADTKYASAFKLLFSLQNLCRQHGDFKKMKLVLMKIADAQKMTGDAHNAEKNYFEIIEIYKNSPPDRFLGKTYKELGDLYKIKQDYKAGISALEKAEKIYSEINDTLELSHTLNNIGNIYVTSNQVELAFSYYRRAFKMQRKLDALKDMASTLSNIGYIYYIRGRYDRVIRLFEISLGLMKDIGNLLEIARIQNNLGVAYFDSAQFEKALENLQESMTINRKIGNKKELLFNHENISQVMISSGRLKEALQTLHDGMSLAGELNDLPHTANFIGNTAIVQKRLGMYGKSLNNTLNAIEMGRKLSDKRDLTIWFINLADLYSRIKDIDSAQKAIKSALELASITSEKRALVFVYSMQGLIENDISCIQKAEYFANEVAIRHDQNLVKIKKGNVLLKYDRLDDAGKILSEIDGVFDETKPDIENAAYFILRGNIQLKRNEIEPALQSFEKALNISNYSSLTPEMIEAAAALGQIYAIKSDYETAFGFYKRAIKGIKSIADDLHDEDQKKSFLSNEKVASLSVEINRLSQILIKKKKAGR